MNMPTIYCDSSNWDDQWIQGVPLDKQPQWFKDNPNEDARSLYEQMNGPTWRSIHDHYNMDDNNPKYLEYGWNDDTTSSYSDNDDTSSSSSEDIEEIHKNVDNIPEMPEKASVTNALTFCSQIESLSDKSKAVKLCEYMFQEIVQHIVDVSTNSKDQQINIKFIVQETIHNPILIKLWAVSEGNHDVYENPIANDILEFLKKNIHAEDKPQKVKTILTHMLVQMAGTNAAIAENMTIKNIFDNDAVYEALWTQVR